MGPEYPSLCIFARWYIGHKVFKSLFNRSTDVTNIQVRSV